MREIKVEWHIGDTGTGKSYTAKKIIDEQGDKNIYFISDYSNGMMDYYCGEEILFLDEFRGDLSYGVLLSLLQGYKQQVHARYNNVLSLWNKVIITSILPPEVLYKKMVYENKDIDTLQQLYRRIDKIVYHYKENGEYKADEYTIEEYKTYDDLKEKYNKSEWIQLTEKQIIEYK